MPPKLSFPPELPRHTRPPQGSPPRPAVPLLCPGLALYTMVVVRRFTPRARGDSRLECPRGRSCRQRITWTGKDGQVPSTREALGELRRRPYRCCWSPTSADRVDVSLAHRCQGFPSTRGDGLPSRVGGGALGGLGDGTRGDRPHRASPRCNTTAQADPDALGGISTNPGRLTRSARSLAVSRSFPWRTGTPLTRRRSLTSQCSQPSPDEGTHARAIHAIRVRAGGSRP